MRQLRGKSVDTRGSRHKMLLTNMGYFHGYKGYRFHVANNGTPRRLNLQKFDELVDIYDFDSNLKAIIYSRIMFIETALRNCVLEAVIADAGSDMVEDVYQKSMIHYRNIRNANLQRSSRNFVNKDYRKAVAERVRVRKIFYELILSRKTNRNIQHFIDKGDSVPLRAVFEELSLGEFGDFYRTLGDGLKNTICKSLGLPINNNVMEKIIYALHPLRNSIAHNRPIHDVRFKSGGVNSDVGHLIFGSLSNPHSDFTTITDYILLIAYMMRKLGRSKTDCRKFINEFTSLVDSYWSRNPGNAQIFVGTDYKKKCNMLIAKL